MRVLLTGAAGMLGREVASALSSEDLRAATRADADLADPAQAQHLFDEARPEIVIHCAAWADVDGCEKDPARAERDNVVATRNVAQLAARAKSRLVHVSTDYVFDGTATKPIAPDAPTGPINVYGRSKLAAEHAIRESGGAFLIVRTAWLVGVHGANFVEAVRARARAGETLSVVSDQRGTPTFTFDLAPALVALARTAHTGLLHLTNAGECTRYEQAQEVVRLEGLEVKVEPVSSDRFPRPARRPKYSVLDNSAANAILGRPLPAWRDSLAKYLKLRPAPVS